MAISVMTWVWNHSRSRSTRRLVLLAIADCANSEGGQAWPSVAELMRKAGLGERAVQAAIKDLEKLGELEVQYNSGPKGCNRYRVLMPPADDAPPQMMHRADDAPPQDWRGASSSQVNPEDPADDAPSADDAPPQNSTPTPAESAHGTVKNRKSSSSKKNAGDEPQRDDVDRLCAHLVARIVANDSKRPNITQAWRKETRLLLDADGRTEEQVHAAIDWCQDSPFWVDKIMSMPKLREKYDQLRLQAKHERDKQNGNSNGSRPSTTDRAMADAQALKAKLRGEA